jgi:hypothetical protein
MRYEIEKKLEVLVGSVLYQSSRAADLAVFHFGDRRINGSRYITEYSLHVQCPWCITRDDRVIVGSSDLYYPAGNMQVNSSEFDWDRNPNRRDELIRDLFGSDGQEFLIDKIEVASAGDFNISMDNSSLVLKVLPDSSMNEEYWRFFKRNSEEPHFVVTANGISL